MTNDEAAAYYNETMPLPIDQTVEAAAKRIHAERYGSIPWENGPEFHRDECRRYARAALTAK